MSRRTAIGLALVALALVIAQFVAPAQDFFHTWQYALVLALLAWVLGAAALDAWRSRERGGGGALSVALCGALLVTCTGLGSGLLGPDTLRARRAPGTVAPLPQIGAAAFFSGADAPAIAAGGATVTLRRRGHAEVVVTPGSRKFVGATVLLLEPRVAAYVEATDLRGNHLSVTQPTGIAFLSPILLFRQQQAIAGADHLVDSFALPGAQREVKAVYFSSAQTAAVPAMAGKTGGGAVLLAVFHAGSSSSPKIVADAGNEIVETEGVRLRVTLGSYPELIVASAPQPQLSAAGLLVFTGGLGAWFYRRTRPAPSRERAAAPDGDSS